MSTEQTAESAAPTEGGAQGHIEAELSRDLGLVSALAIGVGTMIAAGIFTLSGLAVGYVGSAAIVSFLLAALVATFTALTYCEFTSIYPQSGEGYLYARKTFPPPLAYMVGWCLLLGYTSSCGFYIASLSTYFNEFIYHLPIQALAGLIFLGLLTLLNIKGTKESGTFQIVITVGKVILLIWFICGGMSSVTQELIVERFVSDVGLIGSTAALVFITFFGFSAIAASAGEVIEPTKNIPRAIFISMAIVTVLYALVVLVVLAAGLTEYGEQAMGKAAKQYLGPIGGMVIVGGAIFSMVSASNASIMAGSRVALSMAHLGHLPQEIGAVNTVTRTPVVSLLLVGVGIGSFAVLLPLEPLANFANCVLLTALIMVNIALIVHRRKFPDIERPFRVPLVPLLPILGVLSNAYLLFLIGSNPENTTSVILAAVTVCGGFLGYLTWKGTQAAEEIALPGERSKVALERAAITQSKFPILVPIANPANLNQLIDMACKLAKEREGHLVALRVVTVPDQLAPSMLDHAVERERRILDQARARALSHDVPCTTLVRVGHNTARAILETARERSAGLILLGWKGYSSTGQRIMGNVTDDVVTLARTDLMLVKLSGNLDKPFTRLLLPSAGGEHARQAMLYAADLVRGVEGAQLTLCSIVPPDQPQERVTAEEQRLEAAAAEIEGLEIATQVVRHTSIPVGIIKAAAEFDALVVGATRESFTNQVLFGSIPEAIARHSSVPVFVVKRHSAVKALFGQVMTE